MSSSNNKTRRGENPATLFHPAFGQFVDDCRSVNITPEDYRLVYDLANVMSDIYHDEAERIEAVDPVLGYFGIRLNLSEIRAGCPVDGEMSVHGHR